MKLTLQNGDVANISTTSDIATAWATTTVIPPLCFSQQRIDNDLLITAHYRNDVMRVGTLTGDNIPDMFESTESFRGCGDGVGVSALIEVVLSSSSYYREFSIFKNSYIIGDTDRLLDIIDYINFGNYSYSAIRMNISSTDEALAALKLLIRKINTNANIRILFKHRLPNHGVDSDALVGYCHSIDY